MYSTSRRHVATLPAARSAGPFTRGNASCRREGLGMRLVSMLATGFLSAALSGEVSAQAFGPRTDFAIGQGPWAIAIGDLNGDGIPDLVVTERSAGSSDGALDSLSVLLGTGGGAFGPRTDYVTLHEPYSVAIGDFDKDGLPDLAVANESAASVSVLWGTGGGRFDSRTDFPVGGSLSAPISLAIGDLDEDGWLDIVAASFPTDAVWLLSGPGGGGHGPGAPFPTGVHPYGVAIGDLNGDGKLDMAAANYADTTVSVLLATGNGFFSPKRDYATGPYPHAVGIGDLNGDHMPDLIVACAELGSTGFAPKVSVLLGTGGGAFGAKTDFWTGDNVDRVAIGDLDGDSKIDLATVGVGEVDVQVGDGAGGFGPSIGFPTVPYARAIAIGDLNADGRPDLAVTTGSNVVSVLLARDPIITATAGAGGALTPSGAVSVPNGSNQNFGISPEAGYRIDDVLVDGASVGAPPSYTFEVVRADHTIQASFVPGAVGVLDRTPPPSVWLGPASPSPARSATEIHLGLPRAANVLLTVYDIGGRAIATLVDGPMSAGEHVVRWDTRDAGAAPAANGIYFYRLEADGKAVERRQILMR